MDRSEVLTLISKTYTTDAIGQKIPTETERDVFCNVSSVTRDEFYAAGKAGLNPEFRVTMYGSEYNGEEICELYGTRYAIYRTYIRRDDSIELYLEKKAGV